MANGFNKKVEEYMIVCILIVGKDGFIGFENEVDQGIYLILPEVIINKKKMGKNK
jgi:hypothetical protein